MSCEMSSDICLDHSNCSTHTKYISYRWENTEKIKLKMFVAPIPANILAMYRKYELWVSSNPQLVGDIETSVKWLSYILVGMFVN